MSATYATITTGGLQQLMRETGTLIVDLRDAGKFAASHLPGAVSFPFVPTWYNRLFKRRALARLLGPERDRAVVFY